MIIMPDWVVIAVAAGVLIVVIGIPVLTLIGLYLIWKKYGRR